MIQFNENENKTKKINRMDFRSSEHKFKLNISPQLIDTLTKFCKIMDVSEESLINLLLRIHLEEIESGIKIKNYEIIFFHLNFSDLLEDKKKIENKIISEEINQEISITIKIEIQKAIEVLCRVIKIIEPKKFIEDTIEYQLRAIIDDLRKGHYEFLENFYHFSELIKQLELLRKGLVDDETD